MKVLVTGANGYLGTGVVRQLCNDGINVVAACHSMTDIVDKSAQIKICDIFSIDEPYEYFEKPDVLLHMAWKNGFNHNASSHIDDLPKHYNFIKKMIDGGCKHVAVMGTMHEIGLYEGAIKEDTVPNPQNLYGISKNTLREITKILCENAGVTYQWLRAYYIVGNIEYGSSIFSKIALAEKNGQDKFPFTTGVSQCDFINYDDFCLQVATTIVQDSVNGVINICKGCPEKLADRVERFIKENEYKIKLDYGKYPDRPYDSKAVWGDNTKIKQIMMNRHS